MTSILITGLNTLKRLLSVPKDRKAQGMVEYTLMLGLMAAALIVTWSTFGDKLGEMVLALGSKARSTVPD